MDRRVARCLELAHEAGMSAYVQLNPRLLVPQAKIRHYCAENKCGNYRNNYMCPPFVGSPQEIARRLEDYEDGVLLQYSRLLDVDDRRQASKQAKLDFHHSVLDIERLMGGEGFGGMWGTVAGSCELCEKCRAASGEPCPYPDDARTSLSAIGIDVISLLDRLGLDSEFRSDRITWTGCILFERQSP